LINQNGMEYMPLDDSSIKNDNQCDVLKRNIDEMTPNEDESHIVLNKWICVVEDEEKPHSKDNSIPIIFHFASEDVMDIGQCNSVDVLRK
jgi:hypothetical protein